VAIKIGDRIKPFELKSVDGTSVISSQLIEGKSALAVIFSCNHCPYVQAWEDRMIALGETYQKRGVAFTLINSNDSQKYPEDGFDGMVDRAKMKAYPFPYLHDETQATAKAYGATRTPEVFLFEGQGTLTYHGRIDDNYEDTDAVQSHDLRDAIEAVLGGRSPSFAETPPIGCTIKWK